MESATSVVIAPAARHRIDLAFDRRTTSHMSAGMTLYVEKLAQLVPQVAPDLHVAYVGAGDNFDIAEQIGLPLDVLRRRPRLTHVPTPFVPLGLPGAFVLTIHDLIDLHYPQFGKRKVGPYYRFVVASAARRARAVITDDRLTVADLKRFLGVDPGRVRIVPLGVDLPAGAEPAVVRARPFFLYVGNARPHKNLATLLQAWASLPDELDADVVLTGDRPPADLLAVPERPHGEVVFAGRRSDAELVGLYRGARAYVHPALREGFGLPLLEAMRAGTPVIAADAALPHVLAPHAHAFPATDARALRDLLVAVLRDPGPFTAMARTAQTATRYLSWERTARETVAVYREFLA